jgi:hypothetical protein
MTDQPPVLAKPKAQAKGKKPTLIPTAVLNEKLSAFKGRSVNAFAAFVGQGEKNGHTARRHLIKAAKSGELIIDGKARDVSWLAGRFDMWGKFSGKKDKKTDAEILAALETFSGHKLQEFGQYLGYSKRMAYKAAKMRLLSLLEKDQLIVGGVKWDANTLRKKFPGASWPIIPVAITSFEEHPLDHKTLFYLQGYVGKNLGSFASLVGYTANDPAAEAQKHIISLLMQNRLVVGGVKWGTKRLNYTFPGVFWPEVGTDNLQPALKGASPNGVTIGANAMRVLAYHRCL